MTRRKDNKTLEAIELCTAAIDTLEDIVDYNKLMGIEGTIAKSFFSAYFQDLNWKGRHPRMRDDEINLTLDIGYTILFNFIECNLRLFGFDIYVGVYHRLWFQRKSLVCDIMEPFRCIIEHIVLLAFHRKQFSNKDFELVKQEYHLKHDRSYEYYCVFFDELIKYKKAIFEYVQSYYRCFMGRKSIVQYPEFIMQ